MTTVVCPAAPYKVHILTVGDFANIPVSSDIEKLRDTINADRSLLDRITESTHLPIKMEVLPAIDDTKEYVYLIICDYDLADCEIDDIKKSFQSMEKDEHTIIFANHLTSVKRINKNLVPFI